LAVHFCARTADVSLRQYTTDARVLADSVLHYYQQFRPDAVWLSADTWVTAEAMGAAVGFTGVDQPLSGTGQPLIRSSADLDRIPAPDPTTQGRCPLMLDALQRIVRALGDEVFIVACFDQYPFSLACALMGLDQAMLKLIDDRPMVVALMERCAEYTATYAQALAAAGADMLSGGDSPAGLMGPSLYREVALPAEQHVIRKIKQSADCPVSLHICGDAMPILADMACCGADVLELDSQVDASAATRVVGPDIAVWGNLDPVRLLAQGNPEQVRQATRDLLQSITDAGHRRFVLSSGCTLAVETPPENLRAMLDAARQWCDSGQRE
jgi:MtaA/CmuA family methyltransferase